MTTVETGDTAFASKPFGRQKRGEVVWATDSECGLLTDNDEVIEVAIEEVMVIPDKWLI